jgi:transcriptional regulator with XRE-family HTH domain
MERRRATIKQSELKTAREAAGLTQFQLAVAAGLSIASVQKLEGGSRQPSEDSLRNLREVTGQKIGRIDGESA